MRGIVGLAAGVVLLGTAFAQTPNVAENGVLNAASYATAGQPGHAVAPGSLVAIFGSELASSLSVADSIPLSTSLAGITVTFNDSPAPIQFVSPGQVNAQVPWNLLAPGAQSGDATIVVTRDGRPSAPRAVAVAQFSPGIYTVSGDGTGPAVVVNNDDGSVAQPEGSIPGLATRPARPGSAIIVYATGLGPVNPPGVDGAASLDALRYSTTVPTVLIGGREAQVLYSGLSPQFPAVNQLNIVVPDGLAPGNQVPLQLRIGGVTTSEQITIAIGN
jgi:uncharacterized protein (TIGR03437 family)